MATFGDLKTDIASAMVRDDLASGGDRESDTEAAINAAVRQYRVENWWFLTTTVTTTTTASQDYVTRPTGVDRIDRVSIPSLALDLLKIDITELERLAEPTALSNQPSYWAEYGEQIRLWPTPGDTYTLKITGTAVASEMSDDADDTVWTNEAYDLIRASAMRRLFRFPMRDADGEVSALREESDALLALTKTNIDRLDLPVCAGW